MISWEQVQEKPQLLHTLRITAFTLLSALLAAAEFNGIRLPIPVPLAAALPPMYALAVLAGSLLTYFFNGMLVSSPMLIVALVLTTLCRWGIGERNRHALAALAASGAILVTVILFALAGLLEGMRLLVWSGCVVAGGAFAYGISRVRRCMESGFPLRLHGIDRCYAAVCYILMLSAFCSARFFLISFGEICASFVLLTIARRDRVPGGALCGALTAAALLLADGGTAGLAATIGVAGAAVGMASSKKPAVQCLLYQSITLLGVLLCGRTIPAMNAWVNGLLGGFLFVCLPTTTMADHIFQWRNEEGDFAALVSARMDYLSQSIGGVRSSSERIANMLARNDPPQKPIEQVRESVCTRCRSHATCWESGDDATQSCFARLAAAGMTETLTAPEACLKPDRITEAFARLKRQDALSKQLAAQLRDTQMLLFSQMRVPEELLRHTGTQMQKHYNRELTRYVSDLLDSAGIPLRAAAVSECANQRLLIEPYTDANTKLDAPELTAYLEEALQRPLDWTEPTFIGNEQRMVLQTTGSYRIATAAAQCAVHENEPCGDCYDTFTDGEGHLYLVISDGMGSGRRAAVDSKIVLNNFRQLVQSGMDCESAARMINSIMLTKSGEERFATLDVAKISTDTAAVTLYKYGAGPTLMKHGGRITLCQAATTPIGILPKAEPYTTVMTLEPGDMLFLLSDGLDDSLYPYIRQHLAQGGDLQALTHTVCAKAQRDAKGVPKDDVTVLAAMISATESGSAAS